MSEPWFVADRIRYQEMCDNANSNAILSLSAGAVVLSVAACCVIGACLYNEAEKSKENAKQNAENKNALADLQLLERKITYESLMGRIRSYGTNYIFDNFISNNEEYSSTNTSLISFLSNVYNVTTGIKNIAKQCGPISLPSVEPENTENEYVLKFYQKLNEDMSNLNPVFCFFAGLTDNEANQIPPSAYENLPKAALLGLGLNSNLSPQSQLYGFLQYKRVRLLRKDSNGNYLLCKQEFVENGNQSFTRNGIYPSSEQSIGDYRNLPYGASKVEFFSWLSPSAKNYFWDCATIQEREELRKSINRKTRVARYFNNKCCIKDVTMRCLLCSPWAYAVDIGLIAILLIIGAIILSIIHKLEKWPILIIFFIGIAIAIVLAILQTLYYYSDSYYQLIQPFMDENNISYERPDLNAKVIPL